MAGVTGLLLPGGCGGLPRRSGPGSEPEQRHQAAAAQQELRQLDERQWWLEREVRRLNDEQQQELRRLGERQRRLEWRLRQPGGGRRAPAAERRLLREELRALEEDRRLERELRRPEHGPLR